MNQLTQNLLRKSRHFAVDSDSISWLQSPLEYYETLLKCISNTKHTIHISSLYIGTGKLEQNLASSLSKAKQRGVDVSLLFDKHRTHRSAKGDFHTSLDLLNHYQLLDSTTLFSPPRSKYIKLIAQLLDNINPDFSCYINEILGVQHMKICIFDDDVLITGANLEDQYFTNRIDRYCLISNSPGLVQWLTNLHSIIALHKSISNYSPNEKALLRSRLSSLLDPIIDSVTNQELKSKPSNVSTNRDHTNSLVYILPSIQYGSFQLNHTMDIIKYLVSRLNNPNEDKDFIKNLHYYVSSGYLNIEHSFLDVIEFTKHRTTRQEKNFSHWNFVTSAASANSFYKTRGLKGMVPHVYSELLRQLQEHLPYSHVYQYQQPNYTFHSKGLWISEENESQEHPSKVEPFLTLIGSTNLGFRSSHRDLECQFFLVSENENFQSKLEIERKRVFDSRYIVDFGTEPQKKNQNDSNSRSFNTLETLIQYIIPWVRKYF